jgi:hypothetical protein
MKRKLLALAVAVIFILGTVATGFAATFEDVEDTKYEDAVIRLNALEIIGGFPDGTFRPDEPVTRAQFAKIITSAVGVASAAEYAKGTTKFSDVPATHWASGYINVATDIGVIKGRPDGTFGPEDQVTYAEAITMIVRALGYEPAAQAKGGYPGGYLAIAAEKEITEGVNVVSTLSANRGDVAIMVDNSLDVPLMEQVSYGQFPEYKEQPDKKLLTTKLGVDEFEAVVTEIAKVNSKLDDDEIKLEADENEFGGIYKLLDDVTPETIFGKTVTVWAKDDEIFHISIENDEDDLLIDTVNKDATASKVELKVEDDEFDWAEKYSIYINFEKETDKTKVKKGMYGQFVLEDDEVIFANLFKFDTVGVVTDVDDDIIEYVDVLDAKDGELDLSDYDEVYVYNPDFTSASLDDIDKDSVIYFWENDDDELFMIVTNDKVDGTLERIKDDEIKVDGDSYDRREDAIASLDNGDKYIQWEKIADIEDLGDEDVTLLLDLNGEAIFICGDVEETSDTIYGIVTYGKVDKDGVVSVFTKDGDEVDYTAEDRTGVTAYDYETLNYFGNITDGDLEYAIIAFKLNSDGEIDKDEPIDDVIINNENAVGGEKEYTISKEDDDKYVKVSGGGRFYITEDTVIMKALDDGELDPSLISYEDLVEMSFTDTVAVIFGELNKDADMIVFLKDDFEGSKEDVYYGIVTDSPWKVGDDYVATIDLFSEGEDEYTVAQKAYFAKGTVIAFNLNSKDEAEWLAYMDLDGNTADTTADAEIVAGNVTAMDDNYITVAGQTYKFASGAVVYNLEPNDDNTAWKLGDEIRISKIDDKDAVVLLLDEDSFVVAALVMYEEDITDSGLTPVGQ